MDTQESQPLSTESSQSSSGGKPWLKWALVICCVALLSSGATYVVLTAQQRQTPAIPPGQLTPPPLPEAGRQKELMDTANWKIYTNSVLGYSIKYPSSWNLYEFKNYPYSGYPGVLDENRIIITPFSKFPRFSAGDGSGDLYTGIDIYLGNELYTDISDVLKRADKPDVAGNVTKFRKFSINGITAYQETRSTDDSSSKRILIPYPHKLGIIILTYGGNQALETEKKILDQILSTFKFLE